jgi:hypothetical protein
VGAYDRCRGSLTAVRSAEAAREISHREIGVLKVVRTGTLKVSKSRHNRDHPFGRTRGSNQAPPEEAQQEASSENRESEFHESREQLHHISRNRDTRFPIRQIACGPPWRTGGRSKVGNRRRTSVSGIDKSVFPWTEDRGNP